MKIKLLTDSSSDLPLSFVKENSDLLEVLGMPITIGDEEYVDDLGEEFSHDFFYEQLAQGAMPKTSQINMMTFYDKFEELYKEGYATIYIGLSSGLSGTHNNALLAKNMVLEEAGNAPIVVIDSLAASVGLAAMIMYTLELIKDGKNLEEIAALIEIQKLNANHWFAVDSLMHLKNGGRIPAAAAYVGTVLSVKPILTMQVDGKLESYSSVRGKKKAFKYLVSKVAEHIPSLDTPIIVGHANTEKDADILVEELRNQGVENKVIETCLSATIASHVGPGMLALAFMGGEQRESKK